jgi:DNA-binding transcriptional ArsR family regulator
LHHPEKFGLRASWAAGVRSRISVEERKTLEEANIIIPEPFPWIYTLPEPKDGASVLWALRQIPAEQRLMALVAAISDARREILQDVAARGDWDDGDLEALKTAPCKDKHIPKTKNLVSILDGWANAADFGERYLGALQSYYQAFFAEEEGRIGPALDKTLAQAQELAGQVPLPELLEKLSRGVHLPDLENVPELVLVPSYWITPFIIVEQLDENRSMMIFGARPASASLVPGEIVPDTLLQVLKAMADPTRLRILRYLAHEQLTPAEISRRLRLRAPTVTHHLNALRLAGLVHLTLVAHVERRYTARMEAIQEMCSLIEEFLESDLEEEEI